VSIVDRPKEDVKPSKEPFRKFKEYSFLLTSYLNTAL